MLEGRRRYRPGKILRSYARKYRAGRYRQGSAEHKTHWLARTGAGPCRGEGLRRPSDSLLSLTTLRWHQGGSLTCPALSHTANKGGRSLRPCGTRARYVVERCRCGTCRAANSNYQKRRLRRKAYGGEYWQWVCPDKAREHLLELTAPGGPGLRTIASASGLSRSTLAQLLAGYNSSTQQPLLRIHQNTERKVLAVNRDELAPGARVDAAPTRAMIEEMLSHGIPAARVAQAIGKKSPALQLSTDTVTVANARAVRKVHWSLWIHSGDFRKRCQCPLPQPISHYLDNELAA